MWECRSWEWGLHCPVPSIAHANGIVTSIWESRSIQYQIKDDVCLGAHQPRLLTDHPTVLLPPHKLTGPDPVSPLALWPSRTMIAAPALWLFICLTVPRSRLCVPSCHVPLHYALHRIDVCILYFLRGITCRTAYRKDLHEEQNVNWSIGWNSTF